MNPVRNLTPPSPEISGDRPLRIHPTIPRNLTP